MKKRTFSVLFFFTILIGGFAFFLIHQVSFQSDKKKETVNTLYATVLETTEEYVKVIPVSETEEWLINTREPLEKGDFILVTYFDDEFKSITPNEVRVLVGAEEMKKTVVSEESLKKEEIHTTLPLKQEENLLAKIKQFEKSFDGSSKKISKEAKTFVNEMIDFVFFEGKIDGVTFAELKDTSKAKVVYYLLLIDHKIEKYFPKYKQTVDKKITSMKTKLIAQYLQFVNTLCEEDKEQCETLKKDFDSIKSELDISWKNVKETFQYGVGKTKEELKNMYELWRE